MRTYGMMRGLLVGVMAVAMALPGAALANDRLNQSTEGEVGEPASHRTATVSHARSPVVGTPHEEQLGGPVRWSVRNRLVELDTNVLHDIARDTQAGERPLLTLELFDDVSVTLVIRRVRYHNDGAFSISGVFQRGIGGYATITVMGQHVSGFISVPRVGRFTIESADDGLHRIVHNDPFEMPRCGVGPHQGSGLPGLEVAPQQSSALLTEPIVASVLVLYTEEAVEAKGGDEMQLITDIITDYATLNTLLEDSNVNVQFKLIGPYPVEYEEGGSPGDDLTALRDTNIQVLGYPYNQHELRAVYCADFVAMIVSHEDSPICGIANLMPTPSAMNFNTAFSVTLAECMPGDTFAHELGHNMGCQHDHLASGSSGGTYSFSHGHRYFVPTALLTPDPGDFELHVTVMSYPPSDVDVARFSNPLVEYPAGHPTGIFPGSPGEADNARTITLNAPFFSQYGEMIGGDLCLVVESIIDVPDDYPTIQQAINAAQDGDTVRVAAGTYNERIDLIGKAIHLRSHTPNDPTEDIVVIDGQGLGTVVKVRSGEGPATIVNGFTITGGSAENGGGVYISGASPTIANLFIDNNQASIRGGGMYISNGQPSILQTTFHDNFSQMRGGGVYITGGSPVFTSNCLFEANQAALDGSGLYSVNSNFGMSDTTFEANNGANRGAGMFVLGGSPNVARVSFENNSANFMGGAIFSSGSTMTIVESVFDGNTAISQGGAINVMAGRPVIEDSTFINNQTTAPSSRGGAIYTRDSNMLIVDTVITQNSAGANGGGIFNFVDKSMPEQTWVLPDIGTSSICENTPNNVSGPWRNVGGAIICEATQDLVVCPDPANPGGCAGCTYSTIQSAIDDAVNGDVIVVCPGVYNEHSIDFDGKAVILRSTTPTDPAVVAATVIDGQNSNRLFMINNGEGPGTKISGFTLRNGSAMNGAAIYIHSSGPTIDYCVFENNVAGSLGGAIANFQSSATILNSTFINNTAGTNGGGMYSQASNNLTVINCEFIANQANGSGGGMANQSSNPTMTTVTFSDNVSNNWGGGLYNSVSSPLMFDITFAANTANEGGGMMNVAGSDPQLAGGTFCENDPDDIGGNWTDLGGNTFGGACPLAASSPIHAINLTGESGSIVANFNGASNDGSASCEPDGPDVYFSFEVTDGPMALTLDTCGSAGDTSLAVFDPMFNEISCTTTCGGTPCNHPGACLYLGGLEDGTYLIRVSLVGPVQAGSTPGSFTLNYSASQFITGDINSDGVVDGLDLLMLLESWGDCITPGFCPADVNNDGSVDGLDLLLLLQNWG